MPWRLLALLPLAYSSVASADVPKQPTGKWIVHFDEAQCVVERNYGSKDKPLYLALKRPALGNVIQIDVVERGSKGNTFQFWGSIQFAGEAERDVTVLHYTASERKLRVHMANVPLEAFSAAGNASALRIKSRYLDENFALDQFGTLLNVMNHCAEGLRKTWNVKESYAGQPASREDAGGTIAGLFSADDYPLQSIREGDTGAVKAVLLVNEAGRVADCSVIETSGQAALDAQTCAVLTERAIFRPAVGKDGKPAKDAFIQTIVWQLRG